MVLSTVKIGPPWRLEREALGPASVAVLRITEGSLLSLGFRMGLRFSRIALSLAPCLDATARATIDRFGPRPPPLPAHRASKQLVPATAHAPVHAQPILVGMIR